MSTPSDARPGSVASSWILEPGGRPLFIFAHQDDETVCAGIIRRIAGDGGRGAFVWWTNGDGLAPEAHVPPKAYARIRIAEASESLARLGVGADRKFDLESSEIENYRRFTEVAGGGAERERALAYFAHEADRVESVIRSADPDRVFVLAWQGGHPEHDTLHLMVVRAVRRLRRETGRPIPIVQFPAYEFLIACPLRFKPWFGGDVRAIQLSAAEVAAKQQVFEAYPSQAQLFSKFRRLIQIYGTCFRLARRGFSVETFLAKEQFGVVDPELDYRSSTHRHTRLDYIGDDYLGAPIRFDQMIRPLAEAFLESR